MAFVAGESGEGVGGRVVFELAAEGGGHGEIGEHGVEVDRRHREIEDRDGAMAGGAEETVAGEKKRTRRPTRGFGALAFIGGAGGGEFALVAMVGGGGAGVTPVVAYVFVSFPFVPDVVGGGRGEFLFEGRSETLWGLRRVTGR